MTTLLTWPLSALVPAHYPLQPLSLRARLTAALCVALLLLLMWLAADSTVHAWIHSHSPSSENDAHGHACSDCAHHAHDEPATSSTPCSDPGCVIHLFASGHFAVLATFLFLLVALAALTPPAQPTPVWFSTPAFFLPLACGPPTSS